jgi:hypothetical protein
MCLQPTLPLSITLHDTSTTNSQALTFSNPMAVLWCYVEGEHNIFSVSISPDDTSSTIDALKKQIYDEQVKFIVACGSARLTLTKVCYIMISMLTLM